jgi:hypothetical protein
MARISAFVKRHRLTVFFILAAWLLALVWWVVAVLVIAISGPTNFSRKHHKQEEPPEDAESGQLIEPVPARDQEGLGGSGT